MEDSLDRLNIASRCVVRPVAHAYTRFAPFGSPQSRHFKALSNRRGDVVVNKM